MSETAIAENLLRGRNVKALRNLRGLRQVDLASAAGVSRATVARVERGDPSLPVVLAAFARVLGVDEASLNSEALLVPQQS